jgi:hypothetical protein
MAQRRMFSPEIVGTDAFIEMPVSAQVLYFHLGMRADDDGFVNPQITMRITGANADDLRILLAKKFLLQFANGVVVVKHWRINNFIRRDRYKQTNYIEERSLLRVKENNAYTIDESQGNPIDLVPWKSDAETRISSGQPNDNALVNAGKVRLGKDRLEKQQHGEFENVFLSVEEKTKLTERYGSSAARTLIEELSTYLKSSGKRYRDHYATLLNWAKRKGVVENRKPAPPQKLEAPTLTPEVIAKRKHIGELLRDPMKLKEAVKANAT